MKPQSQPNDLKAPQNFYETIRKVYILSKLFGLASFTIQNTQITYTWLDSLISIFWMGIFGYIATLILKVNTFINISNSSIANMGPRLMSIFAASIAIVTLIVTRIFRKTLVVIIQLIFEADKQVNKLFPFNIKCINCNSTSVR